LARDSFGVQFTYVLMRHFIQIVELLGYLRCGRIRETRRCQTL